MKLAICCYVDNKPAIIEEFRWLYTSWVYSGRSGTILAFAHPGVLKAVTLPGVRVIETDPLTERDPIWAEYPFINSIGYLSRAPASTFNGFTHILRTDCDCFLTPNFPRQAPRLPLFGRGQYVQTREVAVKIAEMAERLSLSYSWCHNIGSTILAQAQAVRHFDGQQYEVARFLHLEGFPDGRGAWPGWWWGVLTMYAGEIVANAMWGMGVCVGGLDCMSLSGDPIGALDYHVHAWTSAQDFSKNNFRAGHYDLISLASLRPDSVRNYCLMIAKMAAQGGPDEKR